MLRILTAITTTNPNDNATDENKYIEIQLHPTNQIVKAIYANPLTLDEREQKPNIKIGTEVLVIMDDNTFSFYVLGATQQSIKVTDKKVYVIENSDLVNVKTDKLFLVNGIENSFVKDTQIKTEKLSISNSKGNEIVSLFSEYIDIVDNLIVDGNLGRPAMLNPATKTKLEDLKSRLDTFKE